MKKIFTALLVLALILVCFSALADQTVTLGNSGLCVSIPDDCQSESGTDDDGIAYTAYYNDSMEMDLTVYEADGTALSNLVSGYTSDYGATQSGVTNINGIDAGYLVFSVTDSDGSVYTNILYIILQGSEEIWVDFYVPSTLSTQCTADVMNSLNAIETDAAISVPTDTAAAVTQTSQETGRSFGTAGLILTIPDSFMEDTLTSDDIEYGMVYYGYNDNCDLEIDEQDAGGLSTEECYHYWLSDGGNAKGMNTCGSRTFGVVTQEITDSGETYIAETYLTVIDDKLIGVTFYYDDAANRPAATIAEVMSSAR